MLGLRKLLRARRSGSLLALTVAYSLAVQAMMASVGLSMSAPDQAHSSFSFRPRLSPHTATVNPRPQPHCPFCFIAAQSAGHIATMGEAPAFPAYAGMQIADKFRSISATKRLFRSFAVRSANPALPDFLRLTLELVRLLPSRRSSAYGEKPALLLEIRLRGPAGRHCCSRHRSRNRNSLDCCPATLGTGDPRWRHDRRRLYDTQ